MEVPAGDRRVQAMAVQCYPGHTGKKRLLRLGLRAAAASGLLARMFPARPFAAMGLDAGFMAAWIEEMCGATGAAALHPLIVWPGDPDRGRLYAHLIDDTGQALAFAKLALDEHNAALIRHEAETLRTLAAMRLKLARLPTVVAAGATRGAEFLTVTCAPRTARASDWQVDPPVDSIVAEFAGEERTIRPDDADARPWFPAMRGFYRDKPDLQQAIDGAARDGIRVRRIHGDMNRTNVLRDGDDTWLLDWERSAAAGPAWADPLCMALDALAKCHPGDPGAMLAGIRAKLAPDGGRDAECEMALALAYLGFAGFPDAKQVLEHWAADVE